MARIRTIKPHFFKSHDVAQLSYRARLTWIGLWTYVDDEGRGRDDARIIKGELWPLEDSVTWQDVESDLMELSRSAHVVRYTVEGKHFLAIPTWKDHQVISRPTNSRIPAENSGLIKDFSTLSENSMSAHGVFTAGKGNGSGNGTEEMEVEENLLSDAQASDQGEHIPSNWIPNQKHHDLAQSLHLDINREGTRFRNHAIANNRRLKNWNAGFTNWLKQGAMNAQKYQSVKPYAQSKTRREENIAFVQQLEREQAGNREITA